MFEEDSDWIFDRVIISKKNQDLVVYIFYDGDQDNQEIEDAVTRMMNNVKEATVELNMQYRDIVRVTWK